jgi:hypothetical protein
MKLLYYYILVFLIILSTIDRFDTDYLSTNLLGITVRYSHILSIFPALFLMRYKNIGFPLLFFILALTVSGFYNHTLNSSISLIIAILFSFYIFYVPALCFAERYPDLGVKAILQSSRILMLAGICLQLTGYTERMGAFFYEPAYMSIFMAAYASLCFTESKLVKPIDYILLVLFLYLSASAAFILVIFGVALYLLLANTNKILKLFSLAYLLLLFYYLSIERSNLNYNIIEAFLTFDFQNLLEFSKQRTGERLNFFMNSLQEVIESPLFGIGPRNFQSIYNGIPPANIFFQIILESGLLGFLICILAIKNFFYNVRALRNYKNFITCTSIALLFTLQIESTYMRAYLWIFFGIFNGIIIHDKKTKEGIHL